MEGLMTYLLLCIAILVLLCVLVVLIFLRELDREKFSEERVAWGKERQNLLNRVMSRDWTSYMALVQTESDAIAREAEKEEQPPDPKTADLDRAWIS